MKTATYGFPHRSQTLLKRTSLANKINLLDFKIEYVIGKGSFSKVYLVRKRDNEKYFAMKELKKSALINEKKKSRVATEKDVFRRIDNPFVIKLHYAFQTVDKLYFILDFINGGELYMHMGDQISFKESKVRFYAGEILIGLKALHDNGIIYRDLKPNNILIDHTGHIKLIDFGLSKIDVGEKYVAKSVVGTPNYIAPEVLKRDQHTFMVDWWSYGILVYEMIGGEIPFLDENTKSQ